MRGVACPLTGREAGDIDFYVVREKTEGEYSSIGGRMFAGTEREFVVQETVMPRVGVDRILRFAFELASRRSKGHLTSATKSNGISITMPYWDERVEEMARSYPNVRLDKYHIDILTARFVLHPDWFDVVVASNLFGDILSDLGPACTGTIGIAPSGNINPERTFPSLFEPVHGSAPDIAGQGIANPIGQVWAAAMMLEHLGQPMAAQGIVAAIEAVLSEFEPADPRSRRVRHDSGVRQGVGSGCYPIWIIPALTCSVDGRCGGDRCRRFLFAFPDPAGGGPTGLLLDRRAVARFRSHHPIQLRTEPDTRRDGIAR